MGDTAGFLTFLGDHLNQFFQYTAFANVTMGHMAMICVGILMYRNASTAMSFYKIPTNRVVELGAQVVL